VLLSWWNQPARPGLALAAVLILVNVSEADRNASPREIDRDAFFLKHARRMDVHVTR
jgi:hypothetical protein